MPPDLIAGKDPVPFHPSASHVSPDYRDGWNAALAAVKAARPHLYAQLMGGLTSAEILARQGFTRVDDDTSIETSEADARPYREPAQVPPGVVAATADLQTGVVVQLIGRDVWIESDFMGYCHVMVRHQRDGEEPFTWCTFHYGYRYTDNAAIHREAEEMARRLGARGEIRQEFRKPDFKGVLQPVGVAEVRPYDDAVEALRRALNALPRYSFFLSDPPGVKRVQERSGNWIEWQAAHALFDTEVVDHQIAVLAASRVAETAAKPRAEGA